jgi:NAD(P)-dependent dehydrogenase (short-subunit alcohol dehydrogenase family)
MLTQRYSEDDVDTVLEDMRAGHEANVLGVLKTVYAFLPLIKRGTLKKVVAISSGMGDIAFINETLLPVSAPYSIQKAALSAAFAKLHAAYHGQGILFLSICPGLVETSATSVPGKRSSPLRQTKVRAWKLC